MPTGSATDSVPTPSRDSPNSLAALPDRLGTCHAARATPMLKILLLEDNDDDSLLVMRALRELATVERASSRDQFRNALSMPWDIIMLDFSLPQLNGDEALKLALERAPQTPIIVFSGTITVTKAVEV